VFWKVAEPGDSDKDNAMEFLPSNATCSVDVFGGEDEATLQLKLSA